jgi:hypothetical protein
MQVGNIIQCSKAIPDLLFQSFEMILQVPDVVPYLRDFNMIEPQQIAM